MLGTVDREDWKVKYRDLLGEVEDKQSDWEASQKELRSVASRLAIAAMGRDEMVDSCLEEIRVSLKSGIHGNELLCQLEELSVAVVEHEKYASVNQSIDLSGFVTDLKLSYESQIGFIEKLDSQSVSNQAQALRDLATELNRLLTPNSDDSDDTSSLVRSVLARLGHYVRVVPSLAATLDNLELSIAVVKNDDWEGPIKQLADAIVNAMESLEEERNELELFLEKIVQQLDQFDSWSTSSAKEHQDRKSDADKLNAQFDQEIHQLHSDMEQSTGIDELKSRVQSRVDTIADKMSLFQAREATRRALAEARNAELNKELEALKDKTTKLVKLCGDKESKLMFDSLTGVYSRYAYEQRLPEEFKRWQRHQQPLVYCIWDIDLFKSVNDNFGHEVGDRLLKVIARMLASETRTEDFVARLGGEEFVVLFPHTPVDDAVALANRIRERIANSAFLHKGTELQVTISCGLTEFREGDSPKTAYERADKALYAAKNGGRNRCESL